MSDFELFQSMIDASKGNQNKDMTARFYDRSVKTERIDENGLPVFEDVCFVEIRVKDSYDVYDQPATEEKNSVLPRNTAVILSVKSRWKTGRRWSNLLF